MIKKIKNLKIKFATILFASILTFMQTNAMECEEISNSTSQTEKNISITENKNFKPYVMKIKNYIEKINEKFNSNTYTSIYDLKYIIDDFKKLTDNIDYQLKILNDSNIIELKNMQDIVNILAEINSENILKKTDDKNIIKISKNEKNFLLSFFESLKTFSNEKYEILNKKLDEQNTSLNNNKKIKITEEMFKSYKNFIKILKDYINEQIKKTKIQPQ